MKRLVTMAAVAGTAVLAACGGGDVIVQAFTQPEGGQPAPIADLPVRALPYDRDAVFDSLRAAYSVPEPEIPADLSALQDSIAIANQQWSEANARWAAGRDSLRVLREQMDRIANRASGEYLVLFRQWGPLEQQVNSAKTTSDRAFDRFDQLNKRYIARADSVRLARAQWGDAAYADVDDVISARLKELRLTEVADTTDGSGVARFSGLRAGQWWIHARYDLPFEELYWNIPVEASGEDVQVQLTRQTAQVRPKL